MGWIWTGLLGLVGTAALSFWGWMGLQIIKQGAKLVELESKINQQEKTCCARLEVYDRMDQKLDMLAEGNARIMGILERIK